ncbi:MAG: sigma-54-dependent Fis family transcriptional regulator [Chloroflexi bacterium]|nr:MAG: sigma-54-dependent Fis family transcriptional regulator [Chloroflexota bacterium]TMC30984.1 MAG: sigma-54-dependent Fis family transcriptional regulator [Chloroflexota bacterium]TMC56374.1 MAG: sigma-54-dependent Fis family transcriptional regulator [Chloroflexota bacterium]TME37104.1 MAG: sigma-54-dependent Fis family transcriptional regulator [Chloroflexota bacterium]
MAQRTILVADDDASIRSLLKQLLTDQGYAVLEAATGSEVVEQVKDSGPDLVIMDLRMPELDGIEALQKVKTASPRTAVLIMTAFGTSNAAIKAMELGAFEYITKPFELDKISYTVKRAFQYQDLTQEVEVLRDEISSLVQTERIVGNSAAMQEVYKTIGKVAKADATVLITGESGTGKELVAEALHYNSTRRSGPLVKVSCAALPETLLEAELFGHEKGSFTGAMATRKGRFELADKGTIFLDEIGEMSLATQTKLLRVLQERKIERVGSSIPIKVDIRVIVATNKDLGKQVEANRFRDDLFYRLNVINIHMPPLRERKEDVPALVEHFLAKHRYSASAQPATISEEALRRLNEYNWPGNVRELENVIERAVVLSRGQVITSRELPFGEHDAEHDGEGEGGDEISAEKSFFKKSVAQFEKDLIMKALRDAGGNRSKAAEMLGIYRRLLYAKIKEYALEGYPPKGR